MEVSIEKGVPWLKVNPLLPTKDRALNPHTTLDIFSQVALVCHGPLP